MCAQASRTVSCCGQGGCCASACRRCPPRLPGSGASLPRHAQTLRTAPRAPEECTSSPTRYSGSPWHRFPAGNRHTLGGGEGARSGPLWDARPGEPRRAQASTRGTAVSRPAQAATRLATAADNARACGGLMPGRCQECHNATVGGETMTSDLEQIFRHNALGALRSPESSTLNSPR